MTRTFILIGHRFGMASAAVLSLCALLGVYRIRIVVVNGERSTRGMWWNQACNGGSLTRPCTALVNFLPTKDLHLVFQMSSGGHCEWRWPVTDSYSKPERHSSHTSPSTDENVFMSRYAHKYSSGITPRPPAESPLSSQNTLCELFFRFCVRRRWQDGRLVTTLSFLSTVPSLNSSHRVLLAMFQ